MKDLGYNAITNITRVTIQLCENGIVLLKFCRWIPVAWEPDNWEFTVHVPEYPYIVPCNKWRNMDVALIPHFTYYFFVEGFAFSLTVNLRFKNCIIQKTQNSQIYGALEFFYGLFIATVICAARMHICNGGKKIWLPMCAIIITGFWKKLFLLLMGEEYSLTYKMYLLFCLFNTYLLSMLRIDTHYAWHDYLHCFAVIVTFCRWWKEKKRQGTFSLPVACFVKKLKSWSPSVSASLLANDGMRQPVKDCWIVFYTLYNMTCHVNILVEAFIHFIPWWFYCNIIFF